MNTKAPTDSPGRLRRVSIGLKAYIMTQVKGESMSDASTEENASATAENEDAPTTDSGTGGALASPTVEVDDSTVREQLTAREPSPDSLRRSSRKIANLRAAFEKNDASLSGKEPLRRSFSRGSAKDTDLENEITQLKAKLNQEVQLRQASEEKCKELEEFTKQLQDREPSEESELELKNQSLQREKDSALKEADNAQRQLSDIKRSISTATRVESEMVTDSTFISEMGLLYHEIQNFVVNHFRRLDNNTSPNNLVERTTSITLPRHRDAISQILTSFQPSTKLSIFQSIVTYYLLDIFNEPLLFGLSAQHEWLRNLNETINGLSALLTSPALNKWRAMTLDLIREADEMKPSFDAAINDASENICEALGKLTGIEGLDNRPPLMVSIVRRTVSLSHLFRVQRAQYTFTMPGPGSTFDATTMEDVSLDGQSSEDGVLHCAVFPLVVKSGDEIGDHLERSTVVIKARVLCQEMEEDDDHGS